MASRTTTDPIEILLEMGVDLDNLSEEEDYLSALMEAAATIEVQTKGSGDERSVVLRKEIIKVRKKRKAADPKFKAKKTKISADSFKKGTATETAPQSVGQKALPPAIEPKTSIIPYQKPDEVDDEEEVGKKKKAKTGKKSDKKSNLLEGIAKSVSNIADILKKQYGLKKKKSSNDAKKAEAERRKLKESGLEKRFKGLSKVAEKVIAPVKGALDSILDFFLNIIIGRFLVKFIRWFGDPKNAKKVDSVVRFLVDHGPKLLAAFLLFGTGIGRFAVRLSAVLLKGALRLGAAAAKFAIGFARRHPAAAAITALVGTAALAGAMNKKDDAGSGGAPAPGSSPEPTVSGRFDMEAGQGYINNKPVSLEEYESFTNMSSAEKGQTYGAPAMEQGGLIPNFFGMAKGAGSSVKEKGLGNAAMDFAGNALGGAKNFMDEKGISDVLMAHPLAKLGLLGFDKGKELLGGLTNFLNEKGIGDVLMQHPLAKMGSGFMNFGKDPARDITGESGKDVTGAGVDTQLISARPGDFVVNKKTADAMGPEYFDAISTNTGEKVSGAGPDTQMIAARPGEIVVNRETVDALGPDHFLGLNRFFGGAGANKPKMAKVQAASGGGFVLPTFSSGGMVSGDEEKQPGGGGFPVKSVSHPNTGSGFGVDGVTDYKGRPGVFSKGAAEAFAKMITDSGGAVKGSDIASSQRSKSYNAHVGGVSNSNHLYGNALDIHDGSQTWMRANGQKYGWIVNDYPGSHGGHFNYKGAGASQMNTPDEGSPVATGQGGRALGSTTQRAGTGLRSSGSRGPSKASIVLALKNGVQGKLNTATGKFIPAEFSPAERERYTRFGGKIPETKPKAEPQNKLVGALKGAVTGAALGGVFGGPLGALIGGVAGGVLGSGILSGESDPNKPKRSSFPTGRSGAKEYSAAMKKYRTEKQQAAAEKKKTSDANKPKRSDFPMGRAGGKAYSEALKKNESRSTSTTQPTTPKATTKTLTKEQLLGKSGGMPTVDQLNATATKRHAELMATTDPSSQKRIADYDAKHGAGAYSKELKKKLNKTYSTEKAKQMTTGEVKPTGNVVGRDKLSPRAQKALARMDAQKAGGLQPDMKTSGPALGRLAMSAFGGSLLGPAGMMGGALLGGGVENIMGNISNAMTQYGGNVKDGNKGIMSPEIQKDFEKLNANRAKADKLEAKNKMMSSQGGLRKNLKKDPLFAEYEKIQDDVNHPLHDKVSGDLFADDKPGMRFSDFKKFKSQQGQAKLSPNQPSPASPPAAPSGGGNNMKVIRVPSPGGGGNNPNDNQTGGSDVDATSPGNGNKAKWSILGIPMPF